MGKFDLHIDFTQWIGDERPQYRSGEQSIHDGMTLEEAGIIGFYALNFIDTAEVAQKPAA